MDLVAKIDQLLALIEELAKVEEDGESIVKSPKWVNLVQFDAEICGECTNRGIAMPPFTFNPQVRGMNFRYDRFGFVQIPRVLTWYGWRVLPVETWNQAMQGLRASAESAALSIEPKDLGRARTQPEIAAVAKKLFGEQPDERTIRNWISNNSLRARQRGRIWEFSISDLEALVRGFSLPRLPDDPNVSRNENGMK
jgi:hypothetical protein